MTKIENLENLFKSLYLKYNIDLSNYAPASLERRLQRFLTLHYFNSIESLTDKLLNDNLFFDLFIEEITVNTTEMFRDASCWKVIRDEIIPLVKDLPSIRIWHAGCSSGEEVFSMAILLKEEGVLDKVKVIASDLNKDIIESAKKGCYSIKTMELNEDNYIQSGGKMKFSDYYVKNDSCYLMDQALIKDVRFVKHDLSSGSEFSKFDIIFCRNVMIYFNKDLQEKVFTLFQNSLFKKGFVIIGKKESMAYYSNSRMFIEKNSVEKIYRLA